MLIGGTGAGEGNVVANTGGAGIVVLGTADLVQVLGNSIRSNGGIGIDLGFDGVTANDAGDADSGPNDLLNVPVILAPIDGGTQAAVELDLPAGDYRIEVFTNPTEGADPSGYGEGETLIGAATVTNTGSGVERFLIPLSPAVSENDVLTATATEDLGGGSHGATSEFSAAVTVGPAIVTINSTGDGADDNPGDGYCYTGSNNAAGDPECTLRAAIEEANAVGLAGLRRALRHPDFRRRLRRGTSSPLDDRAGLTVSGPDRPRRPPRHHPDRLGQLRPRDLSRRGGVGRSRSAALRHRVDLVDPPGSRYRQCPHHCRAGR